MSAESASPPLSAEIEDLIDRLVALTEGLPVREVAAIVGVDPSYVSKWRAKFRPTRMQPHALARLRRGVQELERPEGTVAGATMGAEAQEDPVGFARGVLFMIRRQALAMARDAGEALDQLGGAPDGESSPPAKRIGPTAGEIAVGLEVMRVVKAGTASSRRGKSG